MGRTILSATQTWVEEDKALKRFIRALRRSDQDLIQELLALSRRHIAEASYASNLYPMDIYLVSMLLETFRRVKQLETRLETLGVDVKNSSTIDAKIPALPSLISLITPVAESQPHEPEQEAAAGIKYVDLQDGI